MNGGHVSVSHVSVSHVSVSHVSGGPRPALGNVADDPVPAHRYLLNTLNTITIGTPK